MQKSIKISLVITTYNWPLALQSVLLALNNQNAHFEVLIADDGSSPETADMLEKIARKLHYPWRHIWQEDRGFRAAKIRNKAVAEAEGEYIIFLDGDCVPSSTFVHRHQRLAEPGRWVTGNRILLNPSFSKRVTENMLPIEQLSFLYWCRRRLAGDCNRLLPFLHFPVMLGRNAHPRTWKGAKTCNLAIWKADFLKVNGFDESYEGWGYEDSDLVIRLIRSGVYRKSGRFSLPVFHLWHPENDRGSEAENLARLQAVLANKNTCAKLGVEQYSHSSENR